MGWMVRLLDFVLRVDGQGRIVLPSRVRQALGIDGGAELVCRVVGNRIVLEKFSRDSIRRAFVELEELAPNLDLDIEEYEDEYGYFDGEYVFRKIGLRSDCL